MTHMPTLESERLIIRPFAAGDRDDVHRILDVELAEADFGAEGAMTRDERGEWLQWTVLAYEQLAKLVQPPYGERAIVLKSTGRLVGAVGYVPCLNVFGQLPYFQTVHAPADRTWTEFGLYWAVSPAHQRRGFASEAARAMVAHAFGRLGLGRVVATTTYNNAASIGVMQKIGMRLERNPFPDPPWLQVVGILENP